MLRRAGVLRKSCFSQDAFPTCSLVALKSSFSLNAPLFFSLSLDLNQSAHREMIVPGIGKDFTSFPPFSFFSQSVKW